jgi:hypothetical protein
VAMKDWEKKCRQEDVAAGASLEPLLRRPGHVAVKETPSDSESDVENRYLPSTSRGLEMIAQKEARLSREKESLVKQREKNLPARQETRTQLEIRAQELHNQQVELDREMRGWSGVLRLKPLGYDRFFNRYWWFDASLGGGSVNEVQQWGRGTPTNKGAWHLDKTHPPVKGRPPKAMMELFRGKFGGQACEAVEGANVTVRGYGTGSLIIEYVGLETTDLANISIQDQFAKPAQHWGFYDEKSEIDGLIHWLNPKGVREHALHAELSSVREEMVAMMEKRQSEYHEDNDVNVGPSGYVNRWHKIVDK